MRKGAAVLALGAAALLTAACGSSSDPSALRSYMAKTYRVQLTLLPPHATTISEHEAEKLASSTEWQTPPGKRPQVTSAGLWKVKDPGLYIPEHGIHRLLVNNQVDWIVLIHGVNIAGAHTPSGAGATGADDPTRERPQRKPVLGTVAVAINAESGRQIESWALPAALPDSARSRRG